MSAIRSAKKTSNSNTTERTLPGSIVFTAKPARTTSNPNAIHLRLGDRGPVSTCTGLASSNSPPQRSNPWCTGEDSNLRSSKERQIYSLLPLTARPPVHNRRPRRTCSRSDQKHRREAGDHPHDPIPQTLSRAASSKETYRQCGMIAAGLPAKTKLWSWRRDLNPRPSDYKSDALPAELRQPEQPCFPP